MDGRGRNGVEPLLLKQRDGNQLQPNSANGGGADARVRPTPPPPKATRLLSVSMPSMRRNGGALGGLFKSPLNTVRSATASAEVRSLAVLSFPRVLSTEVFGGPSPSSSRSSILVTAPPSRHRSDTPATARRH